MEAVSCHSFTENPEMPLHVSIPHSYRSLTETIWSAPHLPPCICQPPASTSLALDDSIHSLSSSDDDLLILPQIHQIRFHQKDFCINCLSTQKKSSLLPYIYIRLTSSFNYLIKVTFSKGWSRPTLLTYIQSFLTCSNFPFSKNLYFSIMPYNLPIYYVQYLSPLCLSLTTI